MVELLERGADMEARDEDGNALWLASRFGHIAVATILQGRGCEPKTRSKYWTALGCSGP